MSAAEAPPDFGLLFTFGIFPLCADIVSCGARVMLGKIPSNLDMVRSPDGWNSFQTKQRL